MKNPTQPSKALSKVQAIFFLPVLLAFTIGSLPVLLPLMLYRALPLAKKITLAGA